MATNSIRSPEFVIGTRDWLTNAGTIGFLRILEAKKRQYSNFLGPKLSHNSVAIIPQHLDKFSDAYFTHAFAVFDMFPYHHVERQMRQMAERSNQKKGFNKILAGIRLERQKATQSVVLDYASFQNSLSSFLKAVGSFQGNLRLQIQNSGLLDDKQIEALNKDIDKEDSDFSPNFDKGLKAIRARFSAFYQNVPVLVNPSFKGDRKSEFEKAFVEPAIQALTAGNAENSGQLTCRICLKNHVDPVKLSDASAIFGERYFTPASVSATEFRNFFYNLQPDIILCDFCKLLLLCTWAGLNKVPYKLQTEITRRRKNGNEYLFVNMPSFELMKEENDKLANDFSQAETRDIFVEGELFKDLLLKEENKKSEWALQNVLFVEITTTGNKSQGKPGFRYFHMGRDLALLFSKQYAIEAVRRLRGSFEWPPKSNSYLDIRRHVVWLLVQYAPLYPLLYEICRRHLDEPNDPRRVQIDVLFNIALVSAIRELIRRSLSETRSIMLTEQQIYGILSGLRSEGESFQEYMDFKKRQRLAYRLLSLIRASNIDEFYSSLLHIYVANDRSPRADLISLLNSKDTINPVTRAYAFMTGFLSPDRGAAGPEHQEADQLKVD